MSKVGAGNQSQPAKGTKTVVIGCKLPHGLVMEVGLSRDPKAIAAGLHRTDEFDSFTVKGANAARVVGGFGITVGVPAALAERWFSENKSLRYVKDGSIYIVADVAAAKGEAKDRRALKTGLEAIDPTKAGPGKPAIDAAGILAYKKQVSENPARGRQVDELDGPAA